MRLMRTAVALLLCSALLAACSKVPTRNATGKDATPAPDSTSTTTTVRVLAISGDPVMDALISAYYAKYPNDRVEKVTPTMGPGVNINDLFKSKINENAVDVVSFFSIAQLAKDNLVLPLDPYIQKSGLDLKPMGAGLDNLRVEGKLYELPYAIQPNVVMYNKEMFQAAGVPEPKGSWTWDDLRVAAKKTTKGDGADKVWGFSPSFPDSVLSMYFSQKGMSPIQAYSDEATLKEVLQLFGTMIQSDKSMPKQPKRDPNQTTFYSREEFRNGKAAMTVENLQSLRYQFSNPNVKFTVDVAPVPTSAGGKGATQTNAQSFAIASTTKQPDAAWRFLSFVAGPEGAAAVAKAGLLPLYRSPEVKKAWFDRQPAPPPGTEALFNMEWTFFSSSATPSSAEMANLQKLFQAARSAVEVTMADEKPWDQAFAEWQQQVKQIQAETKQ